MGKWTEQALRVLRERYLSRDGDRAQETPEEMCWRVAVAIAQGEARWGKSPAVVHEIAGAFYDMMVDSKFLPNSPTLMNAGKGNQLQYSACYVLPVGDSMEEIFDAVKSAAIIHKSGGGTGFAFSRLRQKDAVVTSTGGKASGPVSFLRVFNGATEAVKQGGTRRGANMGILRIDHPDILEFIECKLDGGIVNFNISVAATDAFMNALQADTEYDLIAPHNGEVVSRLPAREVFDRIVRAAWQTGDPGMVFLDRINASPANPTPEIGLIEATNPCGEQPLLPNEACNLGSINVAQFARRQGEGEWAVDWTELERVVRLSVRFLDDVIEVNPYPLPEIDETVKANRRIGLGVMGWADLLFRMGIAYDSQPALDLGDRLMSFINEKAHDQSAKLAEERGPFPNWAQSIYKHGRPLRNSTVTTIAPTGTISMIAGCSSGVEPAFAVAFTHKVGDRVLPFTNPIFAEVARERGFYSDALMEEVAKQGVVHGLAGVPEDVQRVFVTAHEVSFEWHVRHQGAFQKYTDNGVSKTINLPNSASRRGRGAGVPPRLGAGMPRHHGVPGWLQGGRPPRRHEVGPRRQARGGGRHGTRGGRQAAPADAHRPHLSRRDAARHGVHRRQRARRRRALRGLRLGGQGRIRHHGGGRGHRSPHLPGASPALAPLAPAAARGDRRPALGHRRRPAARVRPPAGAVAPGRDRAGHGGAPRTRQGGGRSATVSRTGREAGGRRHVPGVRSGDVRLRGRLQEVLRLRLQRVLSSAS